MIRRPAAVGSLAIVTILALTPAAGAAPKCFGERATIEGTSERDRIRGAGRNDVIVGLGGSDRLVGQGGDDRLCGGPGHDRLAGGAGNDSLSERGGFNLLLGGDGDDLLRGGHRDEILDGGPGNDGMTGGEGDDTLVGGQGDDLYDGGSGLFDTAIFDGAPVGVTVDLDVSAPQATGDGTDTILGVEGLVGTEFPDTMRGHNVSSSSGDGLFGLAGDDVLEGRDGNDVLVGDDGDDDLIAGPGDDLLDGGPSLTGPPDGDYGHGGTHLVGDECLSLEDSATSGCESFPGRRTRAMSSRWPVRA